MTARFEVQEDKLSICEEAIKDFIAHIQANEPHTLSYISLKEKAVPTRFLHQFIFKDEAARQFHSSSDAVEKFTSILYPNLIAPVEFTEFEWLAETKVK
jgi:quinol monooxygenase YgiN